MRLWHNHPSRTNHTQSRWAMQCINALAIALLLAVLFDGLAGRSVALAQNGTVDSGSNGSDGALNLTTPGTIIFDPRSFTPPLDQDGDNIYHFTTINIAAGVTVKFSGQMINASIYWLASGAVQIAGTIDLSGEPEYVDAQLPVNRKPSTPGAGGYPGGIGSFTGSPAQPGRGPGGGPISSICIGGAGHASVGAGSTTCRGAAYGNNYLVPLLGGSGGAGRPDRNSGGGAGGGAILIASTSSITINGAIRANGGYQGRNESGGGGSGGAIRLVTPTLTGSGRIEALGCLPCSAGRGGANGRVRLEAFQYNLTGMTIDPPPIYRTPIPLFLPEHPPASVRVVSIANSATPQVAANDFATPDVTINASGPATVTIEARYVPLGSVVTLVLISEERTDQVVTSTPLVGVFERSTATVTVTIPTGHSRMYVYTKWTP